MTRSATSSRRWSTPSAVALPSSPGGNPPAAPVPGTSDRQYNYYYDTVNRLISQIIPVTATSISSSTTTDSTVNQETDYVYDGVGNQIAVIVGAATSIGSATYTYYDALGHVKAIVGPSTLLDGTTGGTTTSLR